MCTAVPNKPFSFRMTSRPLVPGISRSTIARSGGVSSAWARARAPSWAVTTWYPALESPAAIWRQITTSSSTTSTRTPVGADSLVAGASIDIAAANIRERGAMAVSDTMLESSREASRYADPRRVADLTLAAAVRAQAEAVYIEPMAMADDAYVITLERSSQVLSTTALDAQLGAAVIARLAFLADIDLSASHASSAVLPVRSGSREAEIVITVRPGTSLCADMMVMARARGRTPVAEAIGPVRGDIIGQY